MRKKLLMVGVLLAAMLGTIRAGEDMEDNSPPDKPIQLPVKPRMQQPGSEVKLTAGLLYVINSKVKCSIRAHPAGIVSIQEKKGPRDITARFVDGNGGEEDRTYDGPFIYVIKAAGKGKVELDVIPFGFKSDAEIEFDALDVDAGEAPRPPPVPDPPMPNPNPGPTKAKPWGIVVIEDSQLSMKERGAFFANPELSALIVKKGYKVRHIDKDVIDPKTGTTPLDVKRFVDFAKGHPYPQFYIVGTDGSVLVAGDMPKDPKEIVEYLVKYGGP